MRKPTRSEVRRATGALAEAPADNAITVAIPANAADVAALQRQLEADAEDICAVTVDDADAYAMADELLTDVVTRKDAAIAMRKSATGPLYGVIKTVEGWFRPLVGAAERAERHLKGEMAVFLVAKANAEREAREAAAQAADTGDAGALLTALATANEAAARAPGRATQAWHWVVTRINAAMVPPEWQYPDVARIEAHAKAAKGDTPPEPIPGVTFEWVPTIGAKR